MSINSLRSLLRKREDNVYTGVNIDFDLSPQLAMVKMNSRSIESVVLSFSVTCIHVLYISTLRIDGVSSGLFY